MTIPDDGETIGLFEPLMVSEGSPARAGLNDLVLELAEKSAAFRSMGYQRLVRDIKAIDMVLDDHNAKRVRKCDVCGGDADADDWCYGCGHHVCVECVERHGHIGSGVHGGIGAMEATS